MPADHPLTATLHRHAQRFSWIWVNPETPHQPTQVNIEARLQDEFGRRPVRWVIIDRFRTVLTKQGNWEWEPSPSSCDDAYVARTRWDSPEAALAFIEATLPDWASEGEMPGLTRLNAHLAARQV